MNKLLLILLLIPSWSQASSALQLKDIVRKSLETSEEIRIKEEEKKKRESEYDEGVGQLFPHVNADIKWTRYFAQSNYTAVIPSSTGPTIADVPLQQDYGLNGSITATQVLWTFGQVYNAILAAKDALKMSSEQVQMTKEEVAYQAKLAYYSAWLSKRSLEIARQSHQNALANEDLLKKRFRLGRPAQSDLIKLQADAQARVPSLKQAEAQFESAMLNLKRMTDWDYAQEMSIVWPNMERENFEQLSAADLEAKALDQGVLRKILKRGVSLSERVVKVYKADFLPKFSAFATMNYQNASMDDTFPTDEMKKVGAVGIAVSIPIWNGGEKMGKLRQAVSDNVTAQMNLKAYEKSLRLGILNAVTNYNAQLATLTANKKALSLAKKSYRLTRDAVESGKQSVSVLNDAELMETKMKLQVELSYFELLRTKIMIDKLVSAKIEEL